MRGCYARSDFLRALSIPGAIPFHVPPRPVFGAAWSIPLDFPSFPSSPLYFFVFLKLSSEKLDLCRISMRTSGGYEELRLSDRLANPALAT